MCLNLKFFGHKGPAGTQRIHKVHEESSIWVGAKVVYLIASPIFRESKEHKLASPAAVTVSNVEVRKMFVALDTALFPMGGE